MNTVNDLKDLTSPQRAVLEAISQDEQLSATFYFTGGTALKALGIVPRHSNDLDFFTFSTVSALAFTQQMTGLRVLLIDLFGDNNVIATEKGFLHRESGMVIDAVHDGVKNIDIFTKFGNLQLAGLKDLAAGKASAFCSRDEIKDYIDIAFLTRHAGWYLRDLAEIAESKFRLGAIREEKLLTELLSKKKQFAIVPDIFLRDGEDNVVLVEMQTEKLLKNTTL